MYKILCFDTLDHEWVIVSACGWGVLEYFKLSRDRRTSEKKSVIKIKYLWIIHSA
jgi:hypothetical protein